jgi:hypothetical protein
MAAKLRSAVDNPFRGILFSFQPLFCGALASMVLIDSSFSISVPQTRRNTVSPPVRAAAAACDVGDLFPPYLRVFRSRQHDCGELLTMMIASVRPYCAGVAFPSLRHRADHRRPAMVTAVLYGWSFFSVL